MGSTIGFYLVIVGALNMGVEGLAGLMGKEWNILDRLFDTIVETHTLLYVAYLLIGIAALITLFGCCCKTCKASKDAVNAACMPEDKK